MTRAQPPAIPGNPGTAGAAPTSQTNRPTGLRRELTGVCAAGN